MKYLVSIFAVLIFLNLTGTLKAQNLPGIYRSEDGGKSWQVSSAGFPAAAVISEFVIHQDKILAATYSNGLYVSKNEGITWSKNGEGLPDEIRAMGKRGNVLYAAPWLAGVQVSFDGGKTWQERNFGLMDLEVSAFFTFENLVYAGTSTGVYCTWNDGQTWMKVFTGAQITDFAQFGNNLFIATATGVFRSEDHGAHWTPILSNNGVYRIQSTEYGIFALTNREGILKSVKGDQNWEACNNGLSDVYQALTFSLIQIDQNIFACHPNGIYLSNTGGLSWVKMNNNFTQETVIMRLLSVKKNVLLAIVNRSNC